jgi:hypothetical protein
MHWLSECDTIALHKPCEEDKKEQFSSKAVTSLYHVWLKLLEFCFTYLLSAFFPITELIPVTFILIFELKANAITDIKYAIRTHRKKAELKKKNNYSSKPEQLISVDLSENNVQRSKPYKFTSSLANLKHFVNSSIL